jgi:DNA-binding XRE family transcriptional regulator
MPEYSRPLGDAVKRARISMKLTQNEVAESIDVDARTILNIENYKGNPKMEVLYPLIRSLKIDSQEIFYPEVDRQSIALAQLRTIIEGCTEQEATVIIPAVQSIIDILRSVDTIPIKKEPASSD